MKRFNQIFLVLLSAVVIFTPLFTLKRVFIMFALFLFWFVSACSLDKRFFKKTAPYLALIAFWGFLSLFLHHSEIANAGETFFTKYLAFSLWTYIWCVFYIFYADNITLLKGPIKVLVAMLLISGILTIRGNIIYPDASRLLAGLSENDVSLGLQLRSLYVGGYDFIYGVVYLVMPTILLLRYSGIKKLYVWSCILIELFVVLLGDFFTGFILAVVMAIFACVKVENSSKALVILFIFVLLFVILKDVIFEMVIGVGNFMGLESLAHRATQMLLGTYQSDYDMKLDDLSRTERALNAIRNIMDSPLLGQLVERSTPMREAGHSEFLTYFERFGLLAVTYIAFFKSFYKRCLNHINSRVIKRYFIFYVWFVIAFLFLDTFDIANATGFVVFFFVPLLFQYVDMEYCNHINVKKNNRTKMRKGLYEKSNIY